MGRRAGRCHGRSLLEFVVCVIVLAVLLGVFLTRAAFYRGEAERVLADNTVATLRAALPIRLEALRREQGTRAVELIAEENPLDWLSAKPENYLGEFYAPNLEKMPHGNWLFDRRDKCLIYLPNSGKSFSQYASNFPKFKVKFAHLPAVKGSNSGPLQDGVVLEQVNGNTVSLER